MTSDENKLEILKKVEDGTLSVEEGSDLIGILDRGAKQSSAPEVLDPVFPQVDNLYDSHQKTSGCWKAAWSMILVVGAVLTAFSAMWIDQGYQKGGLGWAFWLSWIPFILGVLIIALGWILMQSPWLNVNVRSGKEGRSTHVVFSMPVPLKFASWILRTFNQYLPANVKDMGLEDMVDEMVSSLNRGEPFHVEVDDEEDGDHVEIYIGN